MRTTMDKSGRIVVPRELRDRIGLLPGPIDIVADGAGLRIEVVAPNLIIEKDGRVFLGGDGPPLSVDDIREMRLADQR